MLMQWNNNRRFSSELQVRGKKGLENGPSGRANATAASNTGMQVNDPTP